MVYTSSQLFIEASLSLMIEYLVKPNHNYDDSYRLLLYDNYWIIIG